MFTEGQSVKVTAPDMYFGIIGEVVLAERWAASVMRHNEDGRRKTMWFENTELVLMPDTVITEPEFDLDDMELAEIIIGERDESR